MDLTPLEVYRHPRGRIEVRAVPHVAVPRKCVVDERAPPLSGGRLARRRQLQAVRQVDGRQRHADRGGVPAAPRPADVAGWRQPCSRHARENGVKTW